MIPFQARDWLYLAPELWLGLVLLILMGLELRQGRKAPDHSNQSLAGLAGVGTFLTLPWLAWQASLGTRELLGGMYRVDPLAIFFKGLFVGAALLVILMVKQTESTLPKARGEFYLLVLTATLGMFLAASSSDFLMLFVSLELIAITFYILTAYLTNDSKSLEAGMKYIVLGSLASGFFLYGIALLYGAAGSTHLATLRTFLDTQVDPSLALRIGLVLLLAGMAFKAAVVPLHLWVPDVYQGAPTPVAAYLSVGSKATGFLVAIRILMELFHAHVPLWSLPVAWMAGLTILYGNLGAIPQHDIKRLLGYSSIGHAGYLLMGLAAATGLGLVATHFYLLSYLFTNLAAFLVVVMVSKTVGSDAIRSYAGLAQRAPFLAASMFLALLSLAGVPPLAGFFGKFLLLMSVVWRGYLGLALIGIAAVVISLYYYLIIVKTMYVDPPQDASPIAVGWPVRMALWICLAAIVGMGIWQSPFVEWAAYSVRGLF